MQENNQLAEFQYASIAVVAADGTDIRASLGDEDSNDNESSGVF